MKRLYLLFAVCLFCLSIVAHADKVDDYIQEQMQKQHIPGLSLAVVKDGKIIKAKGYGFANLEWSTPVTPETLFQSGSVGKQFTATAIMMLVESGKIGLEDKISQYLDGTPEAWKNITVRHLLTHTSGVGDVYSILNLRQDYTEAELVKKGRRCSRTLCVRRKLVERKDVGDNRTYRFRLLYKDEVMLAFCTFNKEKKISSPGLQRE